MAAIPVTYPTIAPGQGPEAYADIQPFLVHSGNVVNDSALVTKDTVNAGYVVEPTGATNPTPYDTAGANIVGLSMFNSQAVFTNASGASKYATPFGAFSQTATDGALVPNDPLTLKVALFHNGNRFVFSLDPAISLTQSLIGSTIGLATTGTAAGDIWYATTTGTSSALCATVVGIMQGPEPYFGTIGTDTGGRLILQFISSFLWV